MIEFRPFPKIPRLNREIIITEKIDGTNGVIHVADDLTVTAGSRNRWLTIEKDNFGFAKWVAENAEELAEGLGPGTHYGEWWGSGIQRGYGLVNGDKRFSLFNVGRWRDDQWDYVGPGCCTAVPIISRLDSVIGGHFEYGIEYALADLRRKGSYAALGYMNPEGIILYFTAARQYFKVTLENDMAPKTAPVKAGVA